MSKQMQGRGTEPGTWQALHEGWLLLLVAWTYMELFTLQMKNISSLRCHAPTTKMDPT